MSLLKYRLPIRKRLFAYTQTVVRLYANDRSGIGKLKLFSQSSISDYKTFCIFAAKIILYIKLSTNYGI